MEDRHHRNREMFLRLKAFGASHTDIPATTVWPQLLTDLNSVIADLDGHVSSEEVGKGTKLSGTATRGKRGSASRLCITVRDCETQDEVCNRSGEARFRCGSA